MLTSRFDELWELLVERFTVHHLADRDPANVVALATARSELDDVRADIRSERLSLRLRQPRSLNQPDELRRRQTAPGVPVLHVDADLDQLKVNVVQKVHHAN